MASKKKRSPRPLPRPPVVTMGLDVSLMETGIAVIEPGAFPPKILHIEAMETPLKVIGGAPRFRAIRDRVVELARRYEVREVGMEFYGVDNTRSSSIEIVWLHGVLHVALDDLGLNAVYVPVPTLKKWMTGRGIKVEKDDMIKGIAGHYGARLDNHNAAEAYGVACLTMERARHLAGKPSMRGPAFAPYEREAMMKWQRAW